MFDVGMFNPQMFQGLGFLAGPAPALGGLGQLKLSRPSSAGLDAALMGGNLGQIASVLGSMGPADIARAFDAAPGYGMALQQPQVPQWAAPQPVPPFWPQVPNYNVPGSFPGQVGTGIGPRGVNIVRQGRFAARRR